MKPPAALTWVGRRIPQTVRVRLSVAYALLFLAAGATLLGVTYGLVASSLPRGSSSSLNGVPEAKLEQACKLAELKATAPGGVQPVPKPVGGPVGKSGGSSAAKPVPRSCRSAFAAGANAATANQRDQTLHDLLLFSLIGLGAMTLVSGGLGWLMAGRALRPVAAITGAARRASERHLGERLDLKGPRDEVKELADTFDEMLDRLDAAFASQRRFVADASHELRTPLTVMRTAIDVILAKPTRSPEQLEAMAAKVRRSVDQAETLVDALLTLASSERAMTNTEYVDLATAAEDALERVEPGIAQLELRVEASLEPAETSGDRVLLERLVANLVDNAVRHNDRGGWVHVRTGAKGADSFIEVANSGPAVPDDVLPSLFEPFRRMAERTNAHDGVGLGLAIVQSISAAHSGRLEARSQPQGGLVIALAVPRRGPTEPSTGRS